MSLNFSNTRLLGVSQASKFIGGDVFRLSTTQTISIEGFMYHGSQVDSNFSIIQGEINDMKAAFLTGNGFTSISLNGVSIGNGKIISLDFPSSTDITENSITLGKYNATIEVYTASSSVNGAFAPDTDTYDASTVGVINSNAINIENFSENFSFNVTEDDAYNYSQEISINLRKVTGDDGNFGAGTAKAVASAILKSEISPTLGYVDDRYKEYLSLITGTALFSENYNEVRNEYTFSRNLSLLSSYEAGKLYSSKITHAITMNDSGIFNIVESGEVKGMKDGTSGGEYTNAKNGMEIDLLPYAAGRCGGIFSKYQSGALADQGYGVFLNSGNLSGSSKAIRTSKRFNPIEGTVSYEIEFTNDPKILVGLAHNYTIEITKDSNNIATVTQRGTITPYDDKNIAFVFSKPDFDSKAGVATILVEINALYGQVKSGSQPDLAAYQLTSSSISYPRFGTSLTYSKTFSDDEAILNPATNNGLKRLELKYNNGAPIRIKSTQMIPNMKENVYDADQIALGERGITINAIIERDFDSTNQLPDAIITQKAKLGTALTQLINEATTNTLFINSTHMPNNSYDIYPTSCTYSINSANQVSFNLESAYVFKNGRGIGDLGSFFARSE